MLTVFLSNGKGGSMIAIYTRQSIEKKDSLSIDAQVKACADYCKAQGWEYEIYTQDHGFSGKSLDRPGFQAMMSAVRSGQVNKIVCYKLDRISRSVSDFAQLLQELEQYKCDFISVTENFDTSSPIGRAMVYICMVFAQMERENIQERVKSNYYYRSGLGFWGGGPAPYGYQLKRQQIAGKVHTVLEPDPNEAPWVKKMYEWYLEPGGSAMKILRLLTENQVPTKRGYKWTSRVLMDVLSKPLYTQNSMDVYNYLTQSGAVISNPPEDFDGTLSVDLYGKKDSSQSKHKRCRKGSDMYCNISLHEAIIDSDTWLQVQYKILARPKIGGRTGTSKNSWFTGLMICGVCGRHVSFTHSARTAGYYICSSRKNCGWNSCSSKPASNKKFDPIIVKFIRDHYDSPKTKAAIQQAKLAAKTPQVSIERNNLQMELATINNQIDNLLTSLASGNAVMSKYINDKITELDAKRTPLQAKLLQFDATSSVNDELKRLERIEWAMEQLPLVYTEDTFDLSVQVSQALVNNIVFNSDGEVTISFAI